MTATPRGHGGPFSQTSRVCELWGRGVRAAQSSKPQRNEAVRPGQQKPGPASAHVRRSTAGVTQPCYGELQDSVAGSRAGAAERPPSLSTPGHLYPSPSAGALSTEAGLTPTPQPLPSTRRLARSIPASQELTRAQVWTPTCELGDEWSLKTFLRDP